MILTIVNKSQPASTPVFSWHLALFSWGPSFVLHPDQRWPQCTWRIGSETMVETGWNWGIRTIRNYHSDLSLNYTSFWLLLCVVAWLILSCHGHGHSYKWFNKNGGWLWLLMVDTGDNNQEFVWLAWLKAIWNASLVTRRYHKPACYLSYVYMIVIRRHWWIITCLCMTTNIFWGS